MSQYSVYILDTNVILSMSIAELEAAVLTQRTVTTNDVVREVRSSKEKQKIVSEIGEDLYADDYLRMKKLLKDDGVGCLLSYYRNEGTADVGLLAYAIKKREIGESGLIKVVPVVVTEDAKLREACSRYGLRTIGLRDFRNIMTDRFIN